MSLSVLGLYRPTKGNKAEFLNDIERYINSCNNKSLILCGDLNINLLDKESVYTKRLENVLLSKGLHLCINGVTRDASGSLLDQT